MRVLAFDQATAVTGWAFGTEKSDPRKLEGRLRYGVIKAPKRHMFGERLAYIWNEIEALCDRYDPELIGYEEPFFPIQGAGGAKQKERFTPAAGFLAAEVSQDQADDPERSRFNPETLKQLQMVKGNLICLAARRGIPVQGSTPSQWRMTLLGFGRAPKGSDEQFMKRTVKAKVAQMGYEVSAFDESDAIGVWHHTLHGPEAQKRKQGDLLDMLGGSL